MPVPAPLGAGDTFKYTGRGEYDLVFDLEKFGGLPYGKLLVLADVMEWKEHVAWLAPILSTMVAAVVALLNAGSYSTLTLSRSHSD